MRVEGLRDFGASQNPFGAFLLIQVELNPHCKGRANRPSVLLGLARPRSPRLQPLDNVARCQASHWDGQGVAYRRPTGHGLLTLSLYVFGSSSRAWRPSRCGWSGSAATRWPWLAGSRPTPRSPGSGTPCLAWCLRDTYSHDGLGRHAPHPRYRSPARQHSLPHSFTCPPLCVRTLTQLPRTERPPVTRTGSQVLQAGTLRPCPVLRR